MSWRDNVYYLCGHKFPQRPPRMLWHEEPAVAEIHQGVARECKFGAGGYMERGADKTRLSTIGRISLGRKCRSWLDLGTPLIRPMTSSTI
jgi:hypothetical protein